MATSLWQARRDGWKVTIKCDRRREGLKSAKPCPSPFPLHLSSLIAALGADTELDELQKRLGCPGCGTDRFELQLARPPSRGAGEKDQAQAQRKMQSIKTGEVATLGTTPNRWIVFACTKCGRRGEYRRDRLITEFDNTVPQPTLLAIFAHSRGCGLAVPRPITPRGQDRVPHQVR